MPHDGSSFGLVGAAGYIAPRHMDAIKRTNGRLRAAFDPFDSVGVIDRYFPDAHFFTEFETFAECLFRLDQKGEPINYLSICSPNYLHEAHIGYALRSNIDAICEKPLVLDPAELDGLAALESKTGRTINAILQLRLHPSIMELRDKICSSASSVVYDVELTYITSRGRWYYSSWKGNDSKSGGIAANIGVHFFDMLGFLFGAVRRNVVHHRDADSAAGFLEYERARVRWFLSINDATKYGSNGPIRRCMVIRDLGIFDFSTGFEDLHVASYQEILAGRGFGLGDVRSSIETVAEIRRSPLHPGMGEQHAMVAQVLKR